MKKILTILTIFATIATSCIKESAEQIGIGELESVTFKLVAPQNEARAIGGGLLAKNLTYAIYDDAMTFLGIEGKATFVNLETSVELKLVAGKSYYILCWAAADENPYTLSLEEKSVTANYADVMANDEQLDAFYAWERINVVKGMPNPEVRLYRPFAQLNYGTTADDVQSAAKAGVVPTHSSIKLTSYTKFNLATGEVDPNSMQEITFKTNLIPDEKLVTNSGAEYERLGTVYLLWSTDKASNPKPCTLNIYETKGGVPTIIDNPIVETNVNFNRNWRTHIIGTLLTDGVTFNFIIEPVFPDEFIH